MVYELHADAIAVGSPTFDEDEPRVVHELTEVIDGNTGAPIQQCIASGYNDSHRIDVAAKSLIGNPHNIRSRARRINIITPLVIDTKGLYIDVDTLLADVRAQIEQIIADEIAAEVADALRDSDLAGRVLTLEERFAPIFPFVVAPPVFGAPVLVQKGPITAASLAVSAPVRGNPDFHSIHKLVGAGKTVSSPVVGNPAINPIGGINEPAPGSLAVSSPVLGNPIIAQKQVLAPVGFAVASPDIGLPLIGDPYIFPVGARALLYCDYAASTFGTIDGSHLFIPTYYGNGWAVFEFAKPQTGTWRNISGGNVDQGYVAYFIRES